MTFFNHQGIHLHYQWSYSGKKETFVFINALGTDFRIWDEVAAHLRQHGNILRFDKQGHGLSSLTDKTSKLEDYMEDLLHLVRYLKVGKFNLIGLSVGGMIAQLMAHHHPSLIGNLILCNTRHKIGDTAGWNNRIQQVELSGVAGIAGTVLQRWFPEHFWAKCPEMMAGIRTMLERCNTAGYIQTCKAIRDADLTEISKQIKHRTLCVAGSEDLSTTVEDVKGLADLIPGSRFEIIQRSGHLPCVDNSEKISSLILDFIKPS